MWWLKGMRLLGILVVWCLGVHWLGAMVGWGGIACIIRDIIRCNKGISFFVVRFMLLILCFCVWHELVVRFGICGFVIMFDWWLGILSMVMLWLCRLKLLLGFLMGGVDFWVFFWAYDDEARWRGSIKYLGSNTNYIVLIDLYQFI